MDAECNWPGSVHDAKIVANTAVYKNMRTGNLPQAYYNILPGHESIPNYVIGDPAYPLTRCCMKEFQFYIENKIVIFSNILLGAQKQIEMCFWATQSALEIFIKNC